MGQIQKYLETRSPHLEKVKRAKLIKLKVQTLLRELFLFKPELRRATSPGGGEKVKGSVT